MKYWILIFEVSKPFMKVEKNQKQVIPMFKTSLDIIITDFYNFTTNIFQNLFI